MCFYYLRQKRYVIVMVCLSVSNLCKNFGTDLHEILREGWLWANDQMIKFWWRSGPWIRIRIATLVRRILVEVCTVQVLLVLYFTTALMLLFNINQFLLENLWTLVKQSSYVLDVLSDNHSSAGKNAKH